MTVRHSKTDQAGSDQTIAVPAQPDSPYCPVAAVEHWTLAAGVRAGAIFRRFFRGDVPSPHRLSAQSISAIVKRGATAIGRDPSERSGYSLRHGFLTRAARNGSDVFRMAAQSCHRDVRTVMTYVQDETRFDDHPGRAMLRAREPVEARGGDVARVDDEAGDDGSEFPFERERRHATLVAIALEGRATVIDEVRLYASVGRALVDARKAGGDAYAAIESVIAWDAFVESITAADELARSGTFDHLPLVIGQFPTLRRYTPRFLSRLSGTANPRIVAVHRRWRGRAIALEGKTIKQINGTLRREELDVEVEVSFKRRAYRGRQSTARRCFRLVGVRQAETGTYRFYLTDTPPETLDAHAISQVHAARWQVLLPARTAGALARRLEPMLLYEAIDPDAKRQPLLQQVDQGTVWPR